MCLHISDAFHTTTPPHLRTHVVRIQTQTLFRLTITCEALRTRHGIVSHHHQHRRVVVVVVDVAEVVWDAFAWRGFGGKFQLKGNVLILIFFYIEAQINTIIKVLYKKEM